MSEVLKIRARLGQLQVRKNKLDLEFGAILKDLRYTLVPYYEELTELDLSKAKGLLERLLEIQKEFVKVNKEIKKLKEELGEV